MMSPLSAMCCPHTRVRSSRSEVGWSRSFSTQIGTAQVGSLSSFHMPALTLAADAAHLGENSPNSRDLVLEMLISRSRRFTNPIPPLRSSAVTSTPSTALSSSATEGR